MRTAAYILLGFMVAGLLKAAPSDQNNCMTCHYDFEDDSGPSHKIAHDVHIQHGLACYDCHGGDPTLDDMDEVRKSKDWRGAPTHLQVPAFCARCHSDAKYMHDHNPTLPTDQLDKYKTSIHGKLLFGKKDMRVADCISCHTVHQIGDAKTPISSTYPQNIPATCGHCHSDSAYMAPYGIPTNQEAGFRQSVHGIALLQNNDLGAPACNNCHGNHGAAPPGVASLSAVCGNCHAIEADLFNASPHKDAFEQNDFPMCETCHSNHKILKPSDKMVGTKDGSVCIDCHSPDDGTSGWKNAQGISDALAALVAAQDSAGAVLNEATAKGMMTTNEEFQFKNVNQALIQARTMVHTYNADSVLPKTELGMKEADSVKTASASLIDEYYFRRKGLVLATLFITILAIALYVKIKRVDRSLK